MNQGHVTIIGAGLAGSEAAWQIATRGIPVQVYEMRPEVMTKAHRTGCCAELVCSNSLRGAALSNAVGLLKEELRRLGSLIMQAADASRVPAGGALAVDRELFSAFIDEKIRHHPLIKFEVSEVRGIPRSSQDSPVIVATGPLTSPALAKQIELLTGVHSLSFFDAISPIVLGESIDTSKVFRASRYGKGGGEDYLNIPLSETEYYEFVNQVNGAEKFGGHEEVEADCVDSLRPFEGCMPIEDMAARGVDTLLFGPLKPVGLRDPRTGKRPFAVVQLRQDDRRGQLWSMVGFQTRMKHGEQKRVFSMLPGLEQAEFVRLGSVHRNTFIDSPRLLDASLQMRAQAGLFFAGQITGVEGYVESTCAGLLAGLNAWRLASKQGVITLPADTASGALLHYISDPERKNFQPMNISFGLIPCYLNLKPERHRGKDWRRLQAAEQALQLIEAFKGTHALAPHARAAGEPCGG